MIDTDLTLKALQNASPLESDSPANIFKNDSPPEARLLVKLCNNRSSSSSSSISDDSHVQIVYALAILQTKPNIYHHSQNQLSTTEVERICIPIQRVHKFSRFAHVFNTTFQYKIHVKAFLTNPTTLQEQLIGTTSFHFQHILHHQHENLSMQLQAPYGEMNTSIHFGLDWARIINAKLILSITLRLKEKSNGWPFHTAKVFFIFFKWQSKNLTWTPIYRSEPRKPVQAKDLRGTLPFNISEFYLSDVTDGDDDCPLRFEFFHQDTLRGSRLLAFLRTSLRNLRLTRNHQQMHLELNTFNQRPVLGRMKMIKSHVTLNNHYFQIEIQLGGQAKPNILYFDFTIQFHQTLSNQFNHYKFSYAIQRQLSHNSDQNLYRSELSSQSNDSSTLRFKIAKLAKISHQSGRTHPNLTLSICCKSSSNNAKAFQIAQVEPKLPDLLDIEDHHTLPLQITSSQHHSLPNLHGYVRFENRQPRPRFACITATCQLSQTETQQMSAIIAQSSQSTQSLLE